MKILVDKTDESSKNIMIGDKELANMFKKGDFQKLKILGQFNKGFILALLNETDFFILDQHACCEKYNFEDLSRNTVIHS